MSSKVLEDPNYEANRYIALTTAQFRKSLVSNVSYKVTLALPKGDYYFGTYELNFELESVPTKALWVDHRGMKIGNYKVNDVAVEEEGAFHDHRITLPTKSLKVGSNTVTLSLWNKYRKDGVGLHSFIDPKDGEQYMYTQFEPENCHWLFPVFEQPDLKAQLTMSTVVPHDWVTISNDYVDPERESAHEQISSELQAVAELFGEKDAWTNIDRPHHFCFKTTPRIASYLYAIVVGPFDYFEEIQEGFPPMRIYARKTLKEDINHVEMFKVTKAGIKYYEDLFGRAYPFGKYDQVFVPEHNYGAMENVGCVTYNENYLFRGQNPSLAKRLRFSITNLHELAHMWFGNLVTMKWWNDLWLNESFATYMSFLSMSNSPELSYFDTVWATYLQYSFWGINTDQMSSTHPICCEIASTDQAVSIFDGISYGKGSSWLKQVYNVLGHETLKKGLHRYFKTYEWQNTTLPDFVGCLDWAYSQSGDTSMGEGFNFLEWSDSWLQTSGVNILAPEIEYNDDFSVKKFAIRQTCDLRGQNVLRKQKLNAVFYDEDFKAHVIKDIILSDKDSLNHVEYDFKGPVKAVIINHDAHAFAKVRFDQRTLDTFESDLCRIDDYLARSLVWRQLFNQVRECGLSSKQFFNLVVNQLKHETAEQTIVYALSVLSVLINNYLPRDQVKPSKERIFEMLLEWLSSDVAESIKTPLVDCLFGFTSGQKQVEDVQAWLVNGAIRNGEGKELYQLTASHRRRGLKVLFQSNHLTTEAKKELLASVLQGDESDLARNTILTCEASIPDAANKAAVWKEITDPQSTLSAKQRQAQMAGFYALDQLDLCRPYFAKYYEVLPQIEAQHGYKYLAFFASAMLPTDEIDDSHIVALANIKSRVPDTNKVFMNLLQDNIEVLLRCKNVRAYSEQLDQEMK